MKIIDYSEAELSILKELTGRTAKRVVYNFMYYIFDFGDYHVLFPMELEIGKSKTGDQEIKYTKPLLVYSRLQIEASDKIIAENLPIDKIQVLNTILYWEQVGPNKLYINISNELTNKRIAALIRPAFELEEEMMLNPSSAYKHPIDLNFANLITAGTAIESNGRWLVICPVNNCFGFMEPRNGFFFSKDSLSETYFEAYNFVDI